MESFLSALLINCFKFYWSTFQKPGEVDFSYGGEKSQLWKLLSICFKRELKTKIQIINFLQDEGIAIGDVILSCQRINGSSSDNHLKNCEYFTELRDIIIINSIAKIYFTSVKVQTLFQGKIGSIKDVEEVLLISPSGSGVRQISRTFKDEFDNWRLANPLNGPSEFRVYMYKKEFQRGNEIIIPLPCLHRLLHP